MIADGARHFRSVRVIAAVVAIAAGALVLAACGGSATTAEPGTGPPALPADAGHVHGMVRGAGGDSIVIGTHGGLFDLTETAVSKVGATEDIMGLAALPDGGLLSSGHPGPDSADPAALGLRLSTDGGRTWRRVDQVPQDDFHVIRVGGGHIYALSHETNRLYAGTEPGRLRAGPQLSDQFFDLAVDPGSGTMLIGAAAGGLSRSADGGRSWAPIGGAPGLLAWPARARLYMVDAAGDVHLSTDRGATWARRGSIGVMPATVVALSAQELVIAREDGTLVRSSDGGRTWT